MLIIVYKNLLKVDIEHVFLPKLIKNGFKNQN
jgi:hypothetical protein